MSQAEHSAAADLYRELQRRHPREDEAPRRGFGSDALTIGGRIFAALHTGKLMLKLPAARVDALVDEGAAEPFVMRGRVMREWLLVPPAHSARWGELVEEARAFVGSEQPSPRTGKRRC